MNFKISLTIFVVAVLFSSIASITFATTSAFAQTPATNNANNANNNQNFKEFLTCLLDDNANGTVSQAEITEALGATNIAPTEQEIRDCFAPIYITGGTTTNTDNNDDDDTTENGNEEDDEDN
ncbi:MAG: hypothetical protein H0X50_10325 [Nitrosopumilus sp.]|nr:hypothetical protein [Nitrosopumilus sp.]